MDTVAGLVETGVVQRDKQKSFPGVGLPVAVEVIVALVGKEVAIGPACPLASAGELVVDVDEIGNRPHVVVAEGSIVAFAHPRDAVLFLVLVVGQIVAREVNHRRADASQNIGVSQFEFARRIFVVAVGKDHALLWAETGADVVQRRQVATVESGHDHLRLAREIEITRLDAPVRIVRIPPVVRLADRTDEKLGINQRVIATEVIGIHVVERIGVGQTAALVEVFLDVVDQRLVFGRLALPGQTEVFLAHVLRRIEAHAVVVHRVAEPIDPAGDKLAGIFRWEIPRWVIGILFPIARMTDERRRIGSVIGRAVLEAVVELQHDIHQADQLLVQRAAEAVVGSPLEHARRAPEAARLVVVHPHVEILRHHAGISAVIRPVAGVVEDDVRIDLEIHLVGVVHHVAH